MIAGIGGAVLMLVFSAGRPVQSLLIARPHLHGRDNSEPVLVAASSLG
jgi:hypothetical protein